MTGVTDKSPTYRRPDLRFIKESLISCNPLTFTQNVETNLDRLMRSSPLLTTVCLYLCVILYSYAETDSNVPYIDRFPDYPYQEPDAGTHLSIMSKGWPRALYFRKPELYATNDGIWKANTRNYVDWEKNFKNLMGFIGKACNEEKLNVEPDALEWYTQFKHNNPDQMVLIHFNGLSRDPFYYTEDFFAGHWLYHPVIEVLSDIPAESGQSEIKVAELTHFKTNIGRFQRDASDICLFKVDNNGKPDWNHAEQVKLVSVNRAKKTILVKRGQYGTEPLSFRRGEVRAAAHVVDGPWALGNARLLWQYNFSVFSKNDTGETCGQVLARQLGSWFSGNNRLAPFDGLELDVISTVKEGDTDLDGVDDAGNIDGTNYYTIGLIDFLKHLRKELPDDKLLLADGGHERPQRAFGVINGIEREGWPMVRHIVMKDWSSGMNENLFWWSNSLEPRFSYVNHKFIQIDNITRETIRQPEIPWARHRLGFAAYLMFDSAISYAVTPPSENGELVGIFDELKCGQDNKTGWLGQSLSPAIRPGKETPDLLQGKGTFWSQEFVHSIEKNKTTRIHRTKNGIKITNNNKQETNTRITFSQVPVTGKELLVVVKMKAAPRTGYPREYGRMAQVTLFNDKNPKKRSETFSTYANQNEFESVFYFKNLKPGTAKLLFEMENNEDWHINSMTVHNSPDVLFRIYENGLVFANPSADPYMMDLNRIDPDIKYRRIKGTRLQDPTVNNGKDVGSVITIPPDDGLFLVRK